MPRTKPISARQLAANRANAKLSTGPRSRTGLQTVGLNAIKHGLAGNVPVLPNEDRDAHEAYCRELIDEFAPANTTEFNLAQSIATDLWRLERVRALETNIYALGQIEEEPDPECDPLVEAALASARTFINHSGEFGTLSIYEQRINRSVYKNRAELLRLQNERRQARQMLIEQMIRESQPNEPKAIAPNPSPVNDLPAEIAPNGFVCANK